MGFISKFIPSIIFGGLCFWAFIKIFESISAQIIGGLVCTIIMYGILSVIDKKKNKPKVKTDETKQQTKEE